VRLETAKHLLISSELPFKQLARQSGFASAKYLSVVLRRHAGLSPSEFRRRYRRAPLADRMAANGQQHDQNAES
jgi:transcriptional regulator GlxA family with amidase domain